MKKTNKIKPSYKIAQELGVDCSLTLAYIIAQRQDVVNQPFYIDKPALASIKYFTDLGINFNEITKAIKKLTKVDILIPELRRNIYSLNWLKINEIMGLNNDF